MALFHKRHCTCVTQMRLQFRKFAFDHVAPSPDESIDACPASGARAREDAVDRRHEIIADHPLVVPDRTGRKVLTQADRQDQEHHTTTESDDQYRSRRDPPKGGPNIWGFSSFYHLYEAGQPAECIYPNCSRLTCLKSLSVIRDA